MMKPAEHSDAAIGRVKGPSAKLMTTRSSSKACPHCANLPRSDTELLRVLGLLDLYEASAKEEYLLWAIRLQEKQDELFYDPEGGGYFASAPDEHILVRMKDPQVSP